MTDERLTSLSVAFLLPIVADAFSASALRQRKASYLYDTIQYDTVKENAFPLHSLINIRIVVRRNYDKALPVENSYAVPSSRCLSSREYLQVDTL